MSIRVRKLHDFVTVADLAGVCAVSTAGGAPNTGFVSVTLTYRQPGAPSAEYPAAMGRVFDRIDGRQSEWIARQSRKNAVSLDGLPAVDA